MNDVPRIGVIGTGWWATQFHLPGLTDHPGAEVTAVADVDEAGLTAAADRFGVAAAFTDPDELLSSELVDGVVIAVPHTFHYPLAKSALAAGLHVLVEKPMVLRAIEAWDLVDIADRSGLHLMVGYTSQFTRAARRCRELVASGAIGEVIHVAGLFATMVESYYRGRPDDYEPVFEFPVTGPRSDTYSDPAIAGGGQGQTQVTHGMGMVLHVTDRRVDEVNAYMDEQDLDVDLVDAIAYRLDNGAVGTMAATGSLRPGQPQQQEFRYYGTEGFILQDLLAGTLEAHFNDGGSEILDPLDEDERYPARAPARTLADLISGDRTENPAPAVPAARTVEFLEAAYRSVELGRPVGTDELLDRDEEGSS